MNAYKKDFEKSIDFIDWQNNMLKQQAQKIAMLEKEISALRKQLISACNELVEIKR